MYWPACYVNANYTIPSHNIQYCGIIIVNFEVCAQSVPRIERVTCDLLKQTNTLVNGQMDGPGTILICLPAYALCNKTKTTVIPLPKTVPTTSLKCYNGLLSQLFVNSIHQKRVTMRIDINARTLYTINLQ